MEYDGLKPVPIWWILIHALFQIKNRPNTYIIFSDRGNHFPSDIPTHGIDVFGVSLIGNEIQSFRQNCEVILVPWFTTYIRYLKLTWRLIWKSGFLKSSMVIAFWLATAKCLPDPGWNVTRLPPACNSFLYKSLYLQFWTVLDSERWV